MVLFVPGFCNAQTVNNSSPNDQIISDLNEEMETVDEEIKIIKEEIEYLGWKLECSKIISETFPSKEDVANSSDLSQMLQFKLQQAQYELQKAITLLAVLTKKYNDSLNNIVSGIKNG